METTVPSNSRNSDGANQKLEGDILFADLENQIETQIGKFDGKRKYNKTRYKGLTVLQIVLGVFAAMVLGFTLPQEFTVPAKNIALVLTSVTTGISMLLSQFKFRDHFVSYTWVTAQLRQLKSELRIIQAEALSTDKKGAEKEKLRDLHSRFCSVLDASNSEWKGRMVQADKSEVSRGREG